MNLRETAEVLDAIATLAGQGRAMALATIVGVQGSTYRRPGARLLVPRSGPPVGNLSGGCLEGEIAEVALDVMSRGTPRLALYDLTADDEVVWGWGLGCNGAVEVFVEPAAAAVETAAAIRTAIRDERPIVTATVIESSSVPAAPGSRMSWQVGGDPAGSLGSPELDVAARAEMEAALAAGRTTTRTLDVEGGTVRVFLDVVEPPLQVIVCGAGHDAGPLVEMAAGLGWKVTVVDDRAHLLTSERFPHAARLVHAEPERAAEAAGHDARTHVVVMSHNFLRDKAYLRSFAASDSAYLGMLGPRPRFERLVDDLRREGRAVPEHVLPKIHTPAGLDVGAEGPHEIAAAIVAEILAVSRRRNGGFLKDRRAPIHDDLPAVRG